MQMTMIPGENGKEDGRERGRDKWQTICPEFGGIHDRSRAESSQAGGSIQSLDTK